MRRAYDESIRELVRIAHDRHAHARRAVGPSTDRDQNVERRGLATTRFHSFERRDDMRSLAGRELYERVEPERVGEALLRFLRMLARRFEHTAINEGTRQRKALERAARQSRVDLSVRGGEI